MHPSDLSQLVCRQLRAALREPATDEPSNVSAHPLLNYGGFVNRSFRVTAGEHTYHVKLTADAHSLRGLRRWRTLAGRLTERYRAPAMRGWIEAPDVPVAGPVFEWIEGEPPAALTAGVRRDVVDALLALHGDETLRAALTSLGELTVSCARAYANTYHERFVEDMKLVRGDPAPFVDAHLIDWIDDEVARLAESVARSPAFAPPADCACHRDLWLDNLMVAHTGEPFILDWDDTGLGDAMMDWAMVFGPSRARVRPAAETDLPDAGFGAPERERFGTYARASMLDWIIDPLANWIEAAEEPLHGAVVRDNHRRVHEQALALYREIYRS